MRHRVTLMKVGTELRAKAEADRAAAEAEGAARQATEAARLHAAQARRAAELHRAEDARAEESARARALAHAQAMSRQAAAERTEAARHAEALRSAEAVAQRERLELAETRRAAPQAVLVAVENAPTVAKVKEEPEPGHRPMQTPQVKAGSDESAGQNQNEPSRAEEMLPSRRPPRGGGVWTRMAELLRVAESETDAAEEFHLPSGTAAQDSPLDQLSAGQRTRTIDDYADLVPCAVQPPGKPPEDAEAWKPGPPGSVSRLPSWMEPLTGPSRERRGSEDPADTLQHSRGRVASRWYALRELFAPSSQEKTGFEEPSPPQLPPLLAIFSVAGGVGKTTLAASLTRALAGQGERVLLVDTTSRGVLPFFFGAQEMRVGSVRTFAPPSGFADQPVHLVSYPSREALKEGSGEDLEERLRRDTKGFSRVIVDLASAAQDVLESLVRFGARVLVPLAPDMNSVISLASVSQICAGLSDPAGKPVQPSFLLSGFDASQPLQLDVREILQQKLGEALLPFTIRRSPVVGEALAEGMTVMDYATGEGIAKDYAQVAAWLRSLEEPARGELAQARWSER